MTEDLVEFELAKKLNEKGLKINCIGYYDYAGEFHYNYESDIANKEICFCHNKYDNIWHKDLVDAPTISQALKWLREEKNLCVEVLISVRGGWYNIIYEIAPRRGFDLKHMLIEAKSYEEAAIAGIEYCLDNLI